MITPLLDFTPDVENKLAPEVVLQNGTGTTAIYVNRNSTISVCTPYINDGGVILIPLSGWVKHNNTLYQIWTYEYVDNTTYDMEIYDQTTLEAFRDRVNNGEYGLNGELTADITLSGTFTPIGGGESVSQGYRGTFNGNGYSISGLTIESTASYVGLFTVVTDEGIVSNLTLINSSVTKTRTGTGGDVGSIAGYNYGTIIGNSNSGIVTGYATGGNSNVGGIVGRNNGAVSRCSNSGTVIADGYGGGIVGYNQWGGSVSRNNNYSHVTSDYYVGGIVGYNDSGSISNNTHSGTVSGITVNTEA